MKNVNQKYEVIVNTITFTKKKTAIGTRNVGKRQHFSQVLFTGGLATTTRATC
jgi:hypothetical protein